MKKNKRSSKNLKINTRIVLTSVLAIVIPIVIIATFSTVFINTISSYFNFSSVTTNSYSAINQIQWSQTLNTISEVLLEDVNDKTKLKNLESLVNPLEKFNTKIYIKRNQQVFYSTKGNLDILADANKITDFDESRNTNYFGDKGLVLINHSVDSSNNYMILIVNEDYAVNDISAKGSIQEFTKTILGRTGIIVLVIALLFITAIAVISFITSQTIVKPIKKISNGAEEIAKGNLDYSIDYDSTNELGQMAESFNNMRLRLKESIERKNRAENQRKELIAGIAHDLRTPLTSVKGYAEGLRDGIANTPQKQKNYMNIICSSIDDTEKILDELLTYSKLELDGFELDKSTVNVNEFFRDGVEEIKLLLEENNFAFSFMTTCSDDTTLELDVDRFTRVINNIISNSIKYRRENVEGKIDLHINEYKQSIIIEIADNGIGVDKSSLGKIFDTMYRADKARSKVSDGSGLGLSVCKKIVELHGGSIWATSNHGQGLSIFISMPKEL